MTDTTKEITEPGMQAGKSTSPLTKPQDTVLVTGATGKVGRHLVSQLVQAGQHVRALTRKGAQVKFPQGVEVVTADLAAPHTLKYALEGATALHLITFSGDNYAPLQTMEEIIALARQAGVRRISFLTGTEEERAVAKAVESANIAWTHLRPVEFMSNALGWAESIKTESIVRALSGNQKHTMIHEADIAAVAMHALLEEGHAGKTYYLTGPEAITLIEATRLIGKMLGRHIRFMELSEEQAREQMRALGILEKVIDEVIEWYKNPPVEAYTVLPTVEQITGRKPRTFLDWLTEHAEAFR